MDVRHIALVDDNSIFCFIFDKIIGKYEGSKIKVLSFDNGASALKYFVAHKDDEKLLPELVFVDINMPILNGWQMLDSLVNNKHPLTENTPFFIVSSSDATIDINKSKEYSFVKDYLHKPLDKKQLFSILDQYLK